MFDLIEDVEMFLEEYALGVAIVAVNVVAFIMYNVIN